MLRGMRGLLVEVSERLGIWALGMTQEAMARMEEAARLLRLRRCVGESRGREKGMEGI